MDEAQVSGMAHPIVEQSAQFLWPMLDKQYPIMMDDDSTAHLEALSTMTQDESEDSIVRRIAMLRQDQFFKWISGQQMDRAARDVEPPTPAPGSPAAGPAAGPAAPSAGLAAAAPEAGTESPGGAPRSEVASLTAVAREGAI
jgi:hypothetical protein